MVSVEIRGADQLYELNRRLKSVDKKLATKLRRSIRQGVKPAVAATKAAILTLPVTGAHGGGGKARAEHHLSRSKNKDEKAQTRAQKKSGLRRSIAATIKVDIKTGSKTAAARIVVDGSKLPADQRTLPGHLDDPKGWRHPTFGRKPWVAQKGRPWFETTIRKHVGTVRKSILTAMDELAKEVDK